MLLPHLSKAEGAYIREARALATKRSVVWYLDMRYSSGRRCSQGHAQLQRALPWRRELAPTP